MPVNLRNLLFGSILLFTLAGCGVIEIAETPESWGTRAGSYGAEEWVKNEGKGIFPTSDSVAMYCVSVSESGQKDFNWTFQQLVQSTDACAEAFVDGLK